MVLIRGARFVNKLFYATYLVSFPSFFLSLFWHLGLEYGMRYLDIRGAGLGGYVGVYFFFPSISLVHVFLVSFCVIP